jgi:threonine/homoserine/homoserine lactone efflux protein
MPELNQLLVFFATSVLLALSPGPDNLFVVAQSVQNGRAAGLLVTLGLATGLVAHTLAVALGLAALVQASSFAFTLLKFAGAAYLLLLTWKAFRSGGSGEAGPAVALDRAKLYRRGRGTVAPLRARADPHQPDCRSGFCSACPEAGAC